MTKKIHGGARKGSGRKSLGSKKRIKVAITMSPEHYKKTAGNRSNLIEQGLSLLLK